MIYFTAQTFKCVCHCRKAMFRVLGMYNFAAGVKKSKTMLGTSLYNGGLNLPPPPLD